MNMETRAAWKSQVQVVSCCTMKLQDTREKLKTQLTDSSQPATLLPRKSAHSSSSPLLHILSTVPVTAKIGKVKVDLPQRDALELQTK